MKPSNVRKECVVIGFDVRPHWIGFAVFQDSNRLLDFGVTRFQSLNTGKRRLSSLVRAFRPAIIILRRVTRRSRRDQPQTKALMRFIRRLARRFSIEVAIVPEGKLRSYFMTHAANTKQEIASLLTRVFPRLGWKLPPPRKTWQHEHENMPLFDAAALVMSYFELSGSSEKTTSTP